MREHDDRFECPKCGVIPLKDVTTKKTCIRCHSNLIRHNSIEESIRKDERQRIEKLINDMKELFEMLLVELNKSRYYHFCTNCNKEVKGEQAGYPISGRYYVCEFCKKHAWDDDEKGLVLDYERYSEKNIDVRKAEVKAKIEICDKLLKEIGE